jgi:hypothetical protein
MHLAQVTTNNQGIGFQHEFKFDKSYNIPAASWCGVSLDFNPLIAVCYGFLVQKRLDPSEPGHI